MAVSVKISQLNDGGSVTAADYLPVARGNDSLKIPAGQFVVGSQNLGVGSGTMFINSVDGSGGRTLRFRSLSGSEGLNVVNSGDTLVISASGQNPVKTSITGNGTTTTFAINGASSINANNYRVDIDGVLQEPLNDYTISGSNIVFTSAPPNGSKVTVVSNNLVRAYDIIPSDGSVTNNKLTSDIQYSLVPTGAIMPFYRSTAPDGWLICDGSAVPVQFTSLIALVGANTPNLRGMFIRGWSSGTSTTSRDPLSGSRVLGNIQSDEFRSHDHGGITGDDSPDHSHVYVRPLSIVDNDRGGSSSIWSVDNNQAVDTGGASTRHQHSISSQGGLETRPVNIALLYCIKT